jgi:branched-chain amino acid transport system ATP-binding protein
MLRLDSVEVSFGKTKILRGISTSFTSTTRIIGQNGSGKTTLFNAISGFTPTAAGSIYINDIELTHKAPDERARLGLGRVFQNFGIFRELSVVENVSLALSAKESAWRTYIPSPRHTRELFERSASYLASVGLSDMHDQKAANLSGGQMRLLEIARALAMDASVYLLDEPTAGVSPKLKGEVAQAIQLLIKAKKTVLIIEHDMSFIRQFVDRIVVLDQGSIVADGHPDAVTSDPKVQEIYFGKPLS